MHDKLELISLKGRGRAEGVRLMLTYAEHPFTDSRLTIAEWKMRKKKELYGSLPGERKAVDDVMQTLEEIHVGLAPIIRAILTRNYEERISWADIAVIEMLTRFQACYDSFYLAHFPVLKAYCNRFE
ncbi:hypothetical protein ANCDUO_24311, partial [Ancylostoma duodenale]